MIICFIYKSFKNKNVYFPIHSRTVSIVKLVGVTRKIANRKTHFPFRIVQVIIKDGSLQKELNWTHIMRKVILDIYATKGKR